MELISKAGHHMSLAALQQNDPYINKIVDVTGQVALYTFNSKANEWEKTDIEGTLFVYTRSASPYHGFTIMNRLNMENLVEPINKDLEFQLQDPFLLYRNSNLAIYSIWFYDKKDCQRIAQLMTRVVKQEAFQAGQALPDRSTPSRTNGCVEGRPIDILELLSKAKEEYQRSIIGELDVSPNTEYGQNLELLKAVPDGKERATTVPQHEKKQITVEELFGSSLPKEPTLGIPKESSKEKGQPEHFLRGQEFIPSFPFEPPLVSHLNVDPGGDHTGAATVPKNNQHLGPSPVPLPAVKYNLRPSPVFQPGVPGEGHVQPVSPLHLGQPVPEKAAPATQTMRGLPGATSYLPLEVLSQLKPDALPAAGFSKPSLAPNFLPAQLATPECFIEPILKPPSFSNAVAAPIPSLKAGPAMPEEGPSVLLSPSVFQHSVAKTPEPAPPSPSSSLMVTEPPTTISRHQLQETLIHLIKNDSRFLSTIHEAYLQSLTKDLNNVKL